MPAEPGFPGWRRIAMAALAGAAVAAGQAPLNWWALALPALGVLIELIARETRVARALWLGWFGGAGYFAASLFWIVEPFHVDAAATGWMAPFALLLLAFGMALFWAGAAGAAVWIAPRGLRAVALAVTLAAVELTRSYVLTGFPWALIGHIWIDTRIVQLAALIGPVGLTLLTTCAAAAPLALLTWSLWAGTLGGLAVTFALAALVLWGQGQLDQPMPVRAPQIVVRIVQPNAPQSEKWQPDRAAFFVDRLLEMTAAVADPPPDVVIWPETAVPYLLDQSAPVLAAAAAAARGAPVILGINRREGERYFNSLVVTGPDGVPVAVYDKYHLTPFGEYIPMGDLLSGLGISGLAARHGNGFSAGPGAQVLDLGSLGKVLPLICYEAVFAQGLAVAERPDWLVQITNDAWFGHLTGPYQHLAQARLRAVEQGLPLVRSANTGISAVVDGRGRVVQTLALDTAGYADVLLPPALPPTLYSRTGDMPMALLLAGLGLGLVLFRVRNSH